MTTPKSKIIEDMRNKIKIEEYGLENPHTTDFPNTYDGYDDSWNFEDFKKNFKIKIQKYSKDKLEIEFDMIGIDASIANSFRRILLSEVPTIAFDRVYIYNNTSVIQDEVLAHRLGLIPLKANPDLFKFKENPDSEPNSEDTLEYELNVKCKIAKNGSKEDKSSYIDSKVLTSHIKWLPIGNQAEHIKEEDVKPIHDDILIAKMNPGQELNIKLAAFKGIGKDHAKFSPVATAYYKLLTEVLLKTDFYDEQAEKLQKCFSPGVIELIEDNKKIDGRRKAIVSNPRLDLCSRQVFMHEEFKDQVEVSKIRNHFIFTIESTGALSASTLMKQSIDILMMKTQCILNEINSKKN